MDNVETHESANNDEPLKLLHTDTWVDLQDTFKSIWPRGVAPYVLLETQRRWIQEGFDYGFQAFCPYGDIWSGMVALNKKDMFYEVIIQCPTDDTTKLEEALKTTKIIDWTKNIIVPFAPFHIIECIKKVVEHVQVEIKLILESESFIMDKQTPLFENVSLPPGITFGLLTAEHVELVDKSWPHRYPGSEWYFQLLIKKNSGYGLFKNEELISWLFINEAGALGHMFTLKDHRRKKYAELLLKLVCNMSLKDNKYLYIFCVKGNVAASNLYKKIGFDTYDCGISWCYLEPSKKNLN